MKRKIKVAAVGTAISGAAVGGMLGGAGPALAYDSAGLHLSAVAQSPGRLVGGGAALWVPVDVSCNATEYPYVSVGITEAVGGRIASGTGNANVTCVGAHQVISIPVVASPGRAFAPGKAVATTQIGGCLADQTCGSDSNMRTITLRR
ncbi:MAG TPA: hypothetical protein VF317_06185 [Dermatophilaceae bacterium]